MIETKENIEGSLSNSDLASNGDPKKENKTPEKKVIEFTDHTRSLDDNYGQQFYNYLKENDSRLNQDYNTFRDKNLNKEKGGKMVRLYLDLAKSNGTSIGENEDFDTVFDQLFVRNDQPDPGVTPIHNESTIKDGSLESIGLDIPAFDIGKTNVAKDLRSESTNSYVNIPVGLDRQLEQRAVVVDGYQKEGFDVDESNTMANAFYEGKDKLDYQRSYIDRGFTVEEADARSTFDINIKDKIVDIYKKRDSQITDLFDFSWSEQKKLEYDLESKRNQDIQDIESSTEGAYPASLVDDFIFTTRDELDEKLRDNYYRYLKENNPGEFKYITDVKVKKMANLGVSDVSFDKFQVKLRNDYLAHNKSILSDRYNELTNKFDWDSYIETTSELNSYFSNIQNVSDKVKRGEMTPEDPLFKKVMEEDLLRYDDTLVKLQELIPDEIVKEYKNVIDGVEFIHDRQVNVQKDFARLYPDLSREMLEDEMNLRAYDKWYNKMMKSDSVIGKTTAFMQEDVSRPFMKAFADFGHNILKLPASIENLSESGADSYSFADAISDWSDNYANSLYEGVTANQVSVFGEDFNQVKRDFSELASKNKNNSSNFLVDQIEEIDNQEDMMVFMERNKSFFDYDKDYRSIKSRLESSDGSWNPGVLPSRVSESLAQLMIFSSGGSAFNSGKAGIYATAFVMQNGSNVDQALELGMDREDAARAAFSISMVSGLIETIVPDNKTSGAISRAFTKSVFKNIKNGTGYKEAIKLGTRKFLLDVAKEGGEEGLENIGTDLTKFMINYVMEKDVYKDLLNPKEILESTFIGGLTQGGRSAKVNFKGGKDLIQNQNLYLASKNIDGFEKMLDSAKMDDNAKASLLEMVNEYKSIVDAIPSNVDEYEAVQYAADRYAEIKLTEQASKLDPETLNGLKTLEKETTRATALRQVSQAVIKSKQGIELTDQEKSLVDLSAKNRSGEISESELVDSAINVNSDSETNIKENGSDSKEVTDPIKVGDDQKSNLSKEEENPVVAENGTTDNDINKEESSEQVTDQEVTPDLSSEQENSKNGEVSDDLVNKESEINSTDSSTEDDKNVNQTSPFLPSLESFSNSDQKRDSSEEKSMYRALDKFEKGSVFNRSRNKGVENITQLKKDLGAKTRGNTLKSVVKAAVKAGKTPQEIDQAISKINTTEKAFSTPKTESQEEVNKRLSSKKEKTLQKEQNKNSLKKKATDAIVGNSLLDKVKDGRSKPSSNKKGPIINSDVDIPKAVKDLIKKSDISQADKNSVNRMMSIIDQKSKGKLKATDKGENFNSLIKKTFPIRPINKSGKIVKEAVSGDALKLRNELVNLNLSAENSGKVIQNQIEEEAIKALEEIGKKDIQEGWDMVTNWNGSGNMYSSILPIPPNLYNGLYKMVSGMAKIVKAKSIKSLKDLKAYSPELYKNIQSLAKHLNTTPGRIFKNISNYDKKSKGVYGAEQQLAYINTLNNIYTEAVRDSKNSNDILQDIEDSIAVYKSAGDNVLLYDLNPVADKLIDLRNSLEGRNDSEVLEIIESSSDDGKRSYSLNKNVDQEILDARSKKIKSIFETVVVPEVGNIYSKASKDRNIQNVRDVEKLWRLEADKSKSILAKKKELSNLIKKLISRAHFNTTTKNDFKALLSTVENVNSENSFKKQSGKVVDIIRGIEAKAIEGRIEKLRKLKTSKSESGRKKARSVSLKVKDALEFVNANWKTSLSDLSTLEQALEDKISESETIDSKDIRELVMLRDVLIPFKEASILGKRDPSRHNLMNSVEHKLAELIQKGRTELQAQIEMSASKYAKMKELARKDTNAYSNKESFEATTKRETIEKKWFNRALSNISTYLAGENDMVGLMDIISKGPGEIGGGVMQDMISRPLFRSTNAYKKGKIQQKKIFKNKLKEIYGKNWESSVRKNKIPTQVIGYESSTGDMLSLTQNQAYYLYNMYKNTDLKRTFETMGLITLDPDGNVIDDSNMQAIENHLNPKVKQWADWQSEVFFPNYYEGVNDVYRDIYRTNMPKAENYSGKIYRKDFNQNDIDLLAYDTSSRADTFGSSTKSRTNSKKALKLIDGDTALSSYMNEMEYFKAYSVVLRDAKRVFSDAQVKGNIDRSNRANLNKLINLNIEMHSKMGVVKGDNRLIRGLMNTFTTSKLALKPLLTIKQLTSGIAYLNDIGPAQYIKNSTRYVNPANLVSDWKSVYKDSAYLQDRYDDSINNTIEAMSRQYFQNFANSKVKNIQNLLMKNIKIGDAGGIAFGLPVYNYHKNKFIKEGFSEQDAHLKAVEEFEWSTGLAQQSGDIMHKDMNQLGPYRMFNMFQTSQKQYKRHAASAYRQMARGAISLIDGEGTGKMKGNFLKNARKLFLYHSALPMLFEWVSIGAPITDWEEEDVNDMFRAGILGNIESIFLLGGLLSTLIDFIEERPWKKEVAGNLLPFTDGVQSAMESWMKVGKEMDKIDQTDSKNRFGTNSSNDSRSELSEKIIEASIKSTDLLGIPGSTTYNYSNNLVEKLGDQKSSAEDILMTILGYSNSVIDRRTKSDGKGLIDAIDSYIDGEKEVKTKKKSSKKKSLERFK